VGPNEDAERGQTALPKPRGLQNDFPQQRIAVYRLRSYLQAPDEQIPPEIDIELNKANPSQQIIDLRSTLEHSDQTIIVGATPEQIHNLLMCNDSAQEDLFDFILIDEASQMDVAHAILPLCSLAIGGCVILAGDPKQLPPIHQAAAPLNLEDLVGSVYAFVEATHQIPSVMLEENYRSNQTLVEFSHNAGYRPSLFSHSPELRLNLANPLPETQPASWPSEIYWTPEWSSLLSPTAPATCFIYPEGRSSQWNLFEAEAVAAITFLLQGRMTSQLINDRNSDGESMAMDDTGLYTPAQFWQKAVGIVTPHRAQQGLIISRLQGIFSNAGVPLSLIRDAVDTVERFQGQQRDVIIASFALGDPDAIHDEDEFLMSLNRFNVMASRARAKLIVFASQQVVDHISSDLDTLRNSRLLKLYAYSFCNQTRPMTLGFNSRGSVQRVEGIYKFRN
jgi:DNA replication ATP-dependent helicase Dna2